MENVLRLIGMAFFLTALALAYTMYLHARFRVMEARVDFYERLISNCRTESRVAMGKAVSLDRDVKSVLGGMAARRNVQPANGNAAAAAAPAPAFISEKEDEQMLSLLRQRIEFRHAMAEIPEWSERVDG